MANRKSIGDPVKLKGEGKARRPPVTKNTERGVKKATIVLDDDTLCGTKERGTVLVDMRNVVDEAFTKLISEPRKQHESVDTKKRKVECRLSLIG